MPFTPFHMGPGIFVKALLQGSFSLMVFGWSQIVMDIQPLIVLLTGEGQLHGFSHTFFGASLLAVLAAISGKYLSEFALLILCLITNTSPLKILWWVAFMSAFVGTFSHVVMDSIMHGDVQPFYPFSESNSFLKVISSGQLHKFCLYSGLVGAGLYYLVRFLSKQKRNARNLNR